MTHSWNRVNHLKQVTNHTLFRVGHGLVGKEQEFGACAFQRGHWEMGCQFGTPEGSMEYLGDWKPLEKFSTRKDSAPLPQGTSNKVWRHFWLSLTGRGSH